MTQKFMMSSSLSRQTMSIWVLLAAEEYLLPVYEELYRQLVRREVLHADETSLQVLHELRKKPQTGYTGRARLVDRPSCSMNSSPAGRSNARRSSRTAFPGIST